MQHPELKNELCAMEAVILCGGLGTRLREETEFRPKPMVNIGERPILWHIMQRYAGYGVRRFILCLGYRGDIIRDYFLNYRYYRADFSVRLTTGDIMVDAPRESEDWEVVLAETGAQSQTGARIARAMRHVRGERFFATYGDGVADIDLAALLSYHRQSGKTATLTAVAPPSRYGEIVSSKGLVETFVEKPETSDGGINGGYFVFEKPAMRKYFPADPLRDHHIGLEGHVLPRLAADRQLAAYTHSGFWQCMDTPRELDKLNTLYARGDAPWLDFSGAEAAGMSAAG